MWRAQVKPQRARQYQTLKSRRCAHSRENTVTQGKLLRMKPVQDFDILSQQIKQRTIYHHQSTLYRDGTVNSQRACYFHEPFNVASKDIYIIYHSEASQKTLLHRACCLFPVFSPQLWSNKNIFSEACLRRDSVTWTFSWGIHISSAHTGCSA